MQMKRTKKVLVLLLITILLTSLNVRSDTAPNLLELTEGIYIFGDVHTENITGTYEISVDKIWHEPYTDEDIVDLTLNVTDTPPYDHPFNVTNNAITSFVFKDNRTVLFPAYYYSITVDNETIIFFFNITDTLEDLSEDDIIVTYHGENYTVLDLDPMSELYTNISYWFLSFMLGNAFMREYMPLIKYAISPQATIGQEIDYGQYTGEVTGFKEYKISETERYEVIEVHHEEEIVIIDIYGIDPFECIVGESTIQYEKQTGILLHWIEYNSTTDDYYYYNATKIVGIAPLVSEFSVPTLVLLSTILIAIPIILIKRKKK